MKSPTIWILDDEEAIRDVLSTLVRRLGYVCEVFDSPVELLSRIRPGEVDVVFTDVRMEGMDGLELTRQLIAKDPALKVVLLTGFPSITDAVAAIKNGAFDYLTKPFRMEEIRMRIERAMESRELKGRLLTNRYLTWILIASMPLWFFLGFLFAYVLRDL
ncbi:MAG TPA: response regulator [Kiritimatiellia bacterium]|nr:response regulator [Kiritimatiellia bacterium]